MNALEFKTDESKILTHLLSTMRSNSTSSKMKAVQDPAALEQISSETSIIYMIRALFPMFALPNLDSSRYPGLIVHYVINTKGVTNTSICFLQKEIIDEEDGVSALQQDGLVHALSTALPGTKGASARKD